MLGCELVVTDMLSSYYAGLKGVLAIDYNQLIDREFTLGLNGVNVSPGNPRRDAQPAPGRHCSRYPLPIVAD